MFLSASVPRLTLFHQLSPRFDAIVISDVLSFLKATDLISPGASWARCMVSDRGVDPRHCSPVQLAPLLRWPRPSSPSSTGLVLRCTPGTGTTISPVVVCSVKVVGLSVDFGIDRSRKSCWSCRRDGLPPAVSPGLGSVVKLIDDVFRCRRTALGSSEMSGSEQALRHRDNWMCREMLMTVSFQSNRKAGHACHSVSYKPVKRASLENKSAVLCLSVSERSQLTRRLDSQEWIFLQRAGE